MADEENGAQQNLGMSARFNELVLKAGGPTKVARELGASRTTVDNWAAGVTRIPLEAAAKVAVMAGRSLDWLAGIEAQDPAPDRRLGRGALGRVALRLPQEISAEETVGRDATRSRIVDPETRLPAKALAELSGLAKVTGRVPGPPTGDLEMTSSPDDFVMVPLLQVSAAAGRGRFATPDDMGDGEMIPIRETWLRALGLTPGRTHILWALGDSMFPTIRNGDVLLVDRMIDQVLDDGIYVVVVGGGVMVKRIQLRHDGSVVLKSDNPRYDEQTIPADEVPSLVIEGRVRWVGGAI